MTKPRCPGVKLVMKCICIMFEVAPAKLKEKRAVSVEEEQALWWQESTKLLANFHFLDSLLNFDKDGMTSEAVEAIDYYTGLPEFDSKYMVKVSHAAATISRWVKAIDHYHDIKKVWCGLHMGTEYSKLLVAALARCY